ncbi:hypothetical protein [Fimbriimonas ginsengisoli]|uniref:Uncharacterized protein n=1 Tax=Fimbriimonas ginsengisoli Gsoil 348 TaxID=661478 RepID=A0A068NNS6_FIMGI|nr:hypothetical protein [Fimbriimonas ginsengisoli]AIE85076.1 hypothetical protein OP10G_1708 [Fimbriimonas ginsengisoli Gsoil 348]
MSDPLPDPNIDRNDPMVPEYWQLGEDAQDRIVKAGYQSAVVDGIAVDIHDLLQAADRIRDELTPAVVSVQAGDLAAALQALSTELEHVRWHCDAAIKYLAEACEAV